MGCDIHMKVEYQHRSGKGFAEEWTCGDYFRKREDGKYEEVELVGNRDYDLFAALANVRNYDNNKFICEPKGVPDNACAETLKDIESWGMDGHSHSYLTLKELDDFAKNNGTIKQSGIMSFADAEKVDKGESPDCYWMAGGDPEKSTYREWTEENMGLANLVSRLKDRASDLLYWADETTMQHIRIVFWFDN